MQNEMRDKLIELLSGKSIDTVADVEYVADELIANGAILLPCKIGDIIYVMSKSWHVEIDDISSYQITNLTITQNKKGVWTKKYRAMYLKNGKTIDSQINFEFDDIGKTVFLTREEAEKKLEEMKNNETTN